MDLEVKPVIPSHLKETQEGSTLDRQKLDFQLELGLTREMAFGEVEGK